MSAGAQRDAILRFAVGCALAMVLCEALNWRPTALAPVLTGVLLANIPMRPPPKLCLVIVASMVFASGLVWFVSVLLRDTPVALWLAVGILFFATFLAMLRGAPGLPMILVLICLAVIPVVAIAAPAQVGLLPEMLVKAILIAVLVATAMWLLFPRAPPPPRPAPAAAAPNPELLALSATCIVMPLMLLFLLYSPTQALPVMVATVFLVSHFDADRSLKDAYVRVAANAVGGAMGALAHWVLLTAPALATLALLAFLLAFAMAAAMQSGRWPVGTVVLANNGCFVIFSSAIAQGAATGGIALERVFYFSLAGLFVVTMMHNACLLCGRRAPDPQPA